MFLCSEENSILGEIAYRRAPFESGEQLVCEVCCWFSYNATDDCCQSCFRSIVQLHLSFKGTHSFLFYSLTYKLFINRHRIWCKNPNKQLNLWKEITISHSQFYWAHIQENWVGIAQFTFVLFRVGKIQDIVDPTHNDVVCNSGTGVIWVVDQLVDPS